MRRLALLAIAGGLCAAPAFAEDMQLRCVGSYSGLDDSGFSTATITDQSGRETQVRSHERGRVVTDVALDFELAGDHARLRLPPELLPTFNSGKGGWFDARNLVVGERYITGQIKLNFARGTDFTIDRATGEFSTKRGFRSMCEKVDTRGRKF